MHRPISRADRPYTCSLRHQDCVARSSCLRFSAAKFPGVSALHAISTDQSTGEDARDLYLRSCGVMLSGFRVEFARWTAATHIMHCHHGYPLPAGAECAQQEQTLHVEHCQARFVSSILKTVRAQAETRPLLPGAGPERPAETSSRSGIGSPVGPCSPVIAARRAETSRAAPRPANPRGTASERDNAAEVSRRRSS